MQIVQFRRNRRSRCSQIPFHAEAEPRVTPEEIECPLCVILSEFQLLIPLELEVTSLDVRPTTVEASLPNGTPTIRQPAGGNTARDCCILSKVTVQCLLLRFNSVSGR